MPGLASVSPTAGSGSSAWRGCRAIGEAATHSVHKSSFAFDSWHDIIAGGVSYLPPMIRRRRASRREGLCGGRSWGATANGRGCGDDATGEIAGTVDGGNSRLHTPYHR